MTGWRALLARAREQVEVAGAYAEDGALHTAAAKLRDAANNLQAAAEAKDKAMRGRR